MEVNCTAQQIHFLVNLTTAVSMCVCGVIHISVRLALNLGSVHVRDVAAKHKKIICVRKFPKSLMLNVFLNVIMIIGHNGN